MGTVENDVLTKNDDDLTMENVEAQNQNSLAAQKKTDYFPFFTLGISLVQVNTKWNVKFGEEKK